MMKHWISARANKGRCLWICSIEHYTSWFYENVSLQRINTNLQILHSSFWIISMFLFQTCRLFDFTDTMYTYLFCRLPMPIPKILGYVEKVVPQYSDEQFRRLFRMSGDTFENLLSYLKGCEELSTKGYGGRTPITVRKQLMITLWYLGGLCPIIRIADRFGVSESSIILCRIV